MREGILMDYPKEVLRPTDVVKNPIRCKCGWVGSEDDLLYGKIESESRYCLTCPMCGRVYYDGRFLEVRGK